MRVTTIISAAPGDCAVEALVPFALLWGPPADKRSARRNALTWFRKAVILSHRYLGIALSLLFVLWFTSGITMMYAGGMPRLIPDERLERLAPVDLRAVRLTPSEAAEKAGAGTSLRQGYGGPPKL